MRILFDSKNEEYKVPFGCLRQDEKCTLNIKIPCHCNTKKCFVIVEDYEGFYLKTQLFYKETKGEYEIYSGKFSLVNNGLYHYHFYIETSDGSFNLFKTGYNDTNIEEGENWQITCFDKDYDTPADFKGKVFYQIFPDRFFKDGEVDLTDKLKPFYIHENTNECPVFLPDENGRIWNNDFFGGNLKGIEKKLDYIKELGVGVIYLNPIFMAYSNHRYDTADYKRIDPMLGTDDDFKSLCISAHKKGIKIIIDCAFSHTGSNSIYFDKDNIFGTGAYHNENSIYKNWFMFDKYPESYTSWWGIDTLPCVDEMNKDFIKYIITDKDSVVAKYLSLGADGIRLDVADELPDEFIKLLSRRVKQINKDALVMGEVWEDASNKESYGKVRKYFSDTELDSVMNYPYQNAIIGFCSEHISGYDFINTVMTIAENYPKPVLDALMTSLSTHDTQRIITLMSRAPQNISREEKSVYKIENYAYASDKVKLCAFLQFFLPGGCAIYYGDEVGLSGYEDPFNRRFFPWDNIDNDLLSYFKNLSKIKNEVKAFQTGRVDALFAGEKCVAFKRYTEDECYVVIASCDENEVYFDCDEKSILFSSKTKYENGKIVILKDGFAVVKIS